MSNYTRIEQTLITGLSPEEIKGMSVVELTSPKLFQQGKPEIGGPSDLRMGFTDPAHQCVTCLNKGRGISRRDCIGHYGHITLVEPIYNLQFIQVVLSFLQVICHNCGKLILAEIPGKKEHEYFYDYFHKIVMKSKTTKLCAHCSYPRFKKLTLSPIKINLSLTKEGLGEVSRVLPAREALEILLRFEANVEDMEKLGINTLWTRPSYMIWQVLPVIPPISRPPAVQGGKRSENVLTVLYCEIIKANIGLIKSLASKEYENKQNFIDRLTQLVGILYRADTIKQNTLIGINKQKISVNSKTLSLLLDKKEGIVKYNLLGKRVDQSARSVISCDPIIGIEELGVPIEIAMRMSYPEVVTPGNIKRLQSYVLNGPNRYPGARIVIQNIDGQSSPTYRRLEYISNREMIELKEGDIVERHILDGDYVVFNRQPTLHKMGMMGHRTRIFKGVNTFRLALSVTTPYNADFDGDEMNMHLPQSLEATNEVKYLMNVTNFIISPQNSSPLIKFVQDGMLGVGKLTHSTTFLTLKQCLFVLSFYRGVINLSDAVKEENGIKYWSGRQIFSILLPNINLKKTTELYDQNKLQQDIDNVYLVIKNGVLENGIIDKVSLNIIIRIINNEYSSKRAAQFIDDANRVANMFLLIHGSTFSMHDIYVTDETFYESIRKNVEDRLNQSDEKIMDIDRGMPIPLGKTIDQFMDFDLSQTMNKTRDNAYTDFFNRNMGTFPENQLLGMQLFGSKGATSNTAQIVGVVGQQTVGGKRIPREYGERTLPYFTRNDIRPCSQGFIVNSVLTGLTPPEFFSSAISGREGRIDTSVKTRIVGYISKKLGKLLEDVHIQFDGVLTDSLDHWMSSLYGGDGMDPMKQEQQYLLYTDEKLEEMRNRYEWTSAELDKYGYNVKEKKIFETEFKQILDDKNFVFGRLLRGVGRNLNRAFWMPFNLERLIESAEINTPVGEKLKPLYVISELADLLTNLMDNFTNESMIYKQCILLPSIFIRNYFSSRKLILENKLTKEAFDAVLLEIKVRFNNALADPSEPVGFNAAHSISEPLQQATLNAFHISDSQTAMYDVPTLQAIKEKLSLQKNLTRPYTIIYSKSTEEKYYTKLRDLLDHLTIEKYSEKSEIIYDNKFTDPYYEIDGKIVEDYIKYTTTNKHLMANCSHMTIRITLDKNKVIRNKISVGTIAFKLRKKFPQLFIVNSSDNSDKFLLLIKMDMTNKIIQNMLTTKGEIEIIKVFEEKILSETLSGIAGLRDVESGKEESEQVYNPETMEIENIKSIVLMALGTNLMEILECPLVDEVRTVSNNIIEIFQVLGIEAGRKALVEGIYKALAPTSKLSMRHIFILADKMCFQGIPMSAEFSGMVKNHSGLMNYLTREQLNKTFSRIGVFTQKGYTNTLASNIILGQDIWYGSGRMSEVIVNPEAFGITAEELEDLENL